MRALSITFINALRSTDPVREDGISDGLNILCEQSESGKSTIFDALQWPRR